MAKHGKDRYAHLRENTPNNTDRSDFDGSSDHMPYIENNYPATRSSAKATQNKTESVPDDSEYDKPVYAREEDIFITSNLPSREKIADAQRRTLQKQIQQRAKITSRENSEESTASTAADSLHTASNENATEAPMQKTRKRKRGSKHSELTQLFQKRSRPRNYAINVLFATAKLFIVVVLVIGFSGIGAVLGLAKAYVESLPEIDFSIITSQNETSIMYDINGKELYRYYGSENREWAGINEIPLNLQNAFIAIEDVRFRRHVGVDFKRLIGSVLMNLAGDGIQGGSTITQQLIKNTLLSAEQTCKRKLREAYLAILLEQKYSKDEILEAYLNTIPLGGSVYGVKTAAMDYFGKELSELTLRECAMLAGITQNPSKYNPRLNFYSRNNPEQSDYRTDTVLVAMLENGLISRQEYDAALTEEVHVEEVSPLKNSTEMLSYIEYTIYDVITQLLKVNNLTDTQANRSKMDALIRTEGYSIYTTIDPEKQREAEQAVYNYDSYPKMRYESDSYTLLGRNPDGSLITLTQPQAASVVIDYRTGYIVAMVGGRQAPSGQKEFNRAYRSTMPVGSAIKPIAVYAPAIENGLAPGTVLYDTTSPIEGWDTELGYPRNYNNSGYTGAVTLRTGVKKSLNTIAAQTLIYYVGAATSRDTLVAMGVNPDHINVDGPGLALGTSGITPLEMAGAYSTLANMGQYNQPISFTKIVDRNGNVVLDMTAMQEHRQVFKQSTAYQMIDVLMSSMSSNAKFSGQTMGGKTGTVMESRGVFFAGFTGYYVGTVWIGSDDYKPLISSATGSAYAAKLWKSIMTKLHAGLPNKAITEVDPASLGIQKVKFCLYSGKLATENCPETTTDIGLYSDLVADPCTCHQKIAVCADTGMLATGSCPNKTEIVALSLPTQGQLAYMYTHAHQIYAKHWQEPSAPLNSCTKHTAAWGEEDQLKLNLRPEIRRLIETANRLLDGNTLSPDQVQQLNTYLSLMKDAYNDPDNYTYAVYKKYYDDLRYYVELLTPTE